MTECLSNNSKLLYLTISKVIDGTSFQGQILRVNHTAYGVLFAAVIAGEGTLISKTDEHGVPIPFLTTQEILTQLEKFGFYINYDVKSNLPVSVITFLADLDNIGFTKITVIRVQTVVSHATTLRSKVIAFKPTEDNIDLLTFGCKLSQTKYFEKLQNNSVMNITDEPDTQWDWLTYTANISDILDENIDPRTTFETNNDLIDNINMTDEESRMVDSSRPGDIPQGYTLYSDEADMEDTEHV